MIRNIILGFLLISSSVFAQSLGEKLEELTDIPYNPIHCPEEFSEAYELWIEQPVDHENQGGSSFYQRVLLYHRGFEEINVMMTEGYALPINTYIHELTKILNGNQIQIEHRYHGKSIPDSLDFRNLNARQFTADLHRVNQLLKSLYTGKWLCTGVSKGGLTAMHYKHLYPEDIEVLVSYVAPLALSNADPRLYEYCCSLGTPEQQKQILAFQKHLLEKREEFLPLLEDYIISMNNSYSFFTTEEIFENMILHFPIIYWSFGLNHRSLPSSDVSIYGSLVYLLKSADIRLDLNSYFLLRSYSDSSYISHKPTDYLAFTEQGFYGVYTSQFKGLLKCYPDTGWIDGLSHYKNYPSFNEQLSQSLYTWLKSKANKFIFIYGANDCWTGLSVPKNPNLDNLYILMEGHNHLTARISNMNYPAKEKVLTKLEEWLFLNQK